MLIFSKGHTQTKKHTLKIAQKINAKTDQRTETLDFFENRMPKFEDFCFQLPGLGIHVSCMNA